MGFLDNSEKINKEKKLTSKDIAQKYSVIFSFFENTKLQISLVSNEKNGSRFFIKNDIPFFSLSQKKVLKDVRDFDAWGDKISIKDFFTNLKKSGFDIYFKENKKVEKVLFSRGEIHIEDKIEMSFFKAKKTDFFPLVENDFVFRIESDSEFEKFRKKFLLSDGFIFYIKNEKLFFHEIEKDIEEILKRVVSKNYDKISGFFSERLETKLSEDQIFNINKIIKKSKSFFNLKTDIEEDFVIKKYDKSEKKFWVDFDVEKQKMEIKVLLDYGCKKVDIAETVFTKVISGETFFSRRSNTFYGYKFIFNIDEKKISYAQVDHNKEIEMYKNILSFYSELGFNKNLILSKKGANQINHFIESNWKNYEKLKYEIVYEKNKIGKNQLDFKADVNVNFSELSKSGAQEGGNWLSFDAKFYVGENEVSIEQLKLYASGKQSYILGTNNEVVDIKNKDELERFMAMISAFHQNKKSGKFEGKLHSAIELENILTSSEHYTAKFNQGYKNFITEAKSNKPIEKIKIDKKYLEILRDYQKEGLDWMYFLKKYHFGGILADDMGLGKTIQTLIMLELNIVKDKPSIVIVPKTLIGNWMEESKKFAPNMSFLVVDGTQKERTLAVKKSKDFNFIITSYSAFQRDAEIYKSEKVNFNYAVLDEAQYIKNFKTKNAQIVKEIDADYRLALTGTPLENSVAEIWSIFEFLMPGFLGKQSHFTKTFVKPISKGGNVKKIKDLRKRISIFMLRRTKESVLKELPEKTVQNLSVKLSEDQNVLYQEILSNIKSDVLSGVDGKNFGKSYMNILAALTRLRQVCNHPNLVLKDADHKKYSSAKLDLFLNLVSDIKSEGRKVLVFSQFKSMLAILQKELDEKNIKYSYLAGETKNRKDIIDEFNNNEDISVFLISLKAGGVGINLTSADNVILFDPWWNPSVERQAIDRTHRIGQKKKVNVYKMITAGTVEEKILKLQDKKQGLFDSLINDSQDSFKKLSWDDIRELFN
jgi:SNF2 family DNA or RNA helicase